jgi:hypothetical protein
MYLFPINYCCVTQMKKMWHSFRHNQIDKKVKYKSYCLLSYSAKAMYLHCI